MAFPVFVIEGADCSGKTTLGEFLTKRWDATYIHATYRFPNQMFDYHTALLNKVIALSQTRPVVLDRWWPSELIYAEAFRGGSKWPMGGRMLDRVALKHGFIYVGCIPQDQAWHKRTFDERAKAGGEMYTKNDEVAQLYRDWDERMIGRSDYMRYDVGLHGKDMGHYADMLEECAGFVQRLQIQHWADPDIKDWAGNSHQPLALILGEKSNPKGRHELWPFFEHANSSLYLTEALAAADVKEERLAWYNVLDKDGIARPQLLQGLYDKIKPHYVVALGSNPSKVALAAGLVVPEHGYRFVNHPSYLKRFKGESGRQELIAFFRTLKEQG